MIRTVALIVASVAALSATAASAQIVNLASVDTATGLQAAPTVLMLGAGVYTASLVGIAGGGQYDAWNTSSSNGQFYPTGTPQPGTNTYTERYNVSIGGAAASTVYPAGGYSSAAAALAANIASPYTFTVTSANTPVSFAITDLPGLYLDNTGGVSLNVAAVPEPASWAMMILGIGAVGFAMRSAKRRSDQKFEAKIRRITYGAAA